MTGVESVTISGPGTSALDGLWLNDTTCGGVEAEPVCQATGPAASCLLSLSLSLSHTHTHTHADTHTHTHTRANDSADHPPATEAHPANVPRLTSPSLSSRDLVHRRSLRSWLLMVGLTSPHTSTDERGRSGDHGTAALEARGGWPPRACPGLRGPSDSVYASNTPAVPLDTPDLSLGTSSPPRWQHPRYRRCKHRLLAVGTRIAPFGRVGEGDAVRTIPARGPRRALDQRLLERNPRPDAW